MLIAMAVHDTVENGRTWMTKATLLSLKETVNWGHHRLTVSDNGSCDETLELYRKYLPPPWVIYNGENLGTARAINKAWQYRKPGEHAVKMDNDVVIHQADWCDWLEDVFDRDPTIGIVGLKRKDLAESPWAEGSMKSTLRMLPHLRGHRWLVVEEVRAVMGTCLAFSSALLDRIGYLTQPGPYYGYDDILASVRARVAGFKRVFLHGFELDHIDPGGDAYCEWKHAEAAQATDKFNTTKVMLETGIESYYYDGGFDQ